MGWHVPDRVLSGALIFSSVSAALLVGAVVRRELMSPTPMPFAEPAVVVRWKEVARTGHRMGSPSPSVTIVEFSDFQCSYCSGFAANLRTLQARYPEQIQIVFRHNPLSHIHPFARDAAGSSICAARQHAFEAYHDRLFAQQDSIGLKSWRSFALESGVSDIESFTACLRDPTVGAEIARDLTDASELGLRVTPSFLVNETRYVGDLGLDSLNAFVVRAMKKNQISAPRSDLRRLSATRSFADMHGSRSDR